MDTQNTKAWIRDQLQQSDTEQESLAELLGESFVLLDSYQQELDDREEELVVREDQIQETTKANRIAERRLESVQEKLSDCEEKLSATRSTVDDAAQELSDAQKQIETLSDQILERTDELRKTEDVQSEMRTELEVAQKRVCELEGISTAAENHSKSVEQHWDEEFKLMRDLLNRRAEWGRSRGQEEEKPVEEEPAYVETKYEYDTDPVLGSVVAQFDKLRQQSSVRRKEGKDKA